MKTEWLNRYLRIYAAIFYIKSCLNTVFLYSLNNFQKKQNNSGWSRTMGWINHLLYVLYYILMTLHMVPEKRLEGHLSPLLHVFSKNWASLLKCFYLVFLESKPCFCLKLWWFSVVYGDVRLHRRNLKECKDKPM